MALKPPAPLTGDEAALFLKILAEEIEKYQYDSPRDAIERVHILLHNQGVVTTEAQLRETISPRCLTHAEQRILASECTVSVLPQQGTALRRVLGLPMAKPLGPLARENSKSFLIHVTEGRSLGALAYIWNIAPQEINEILRASINVQYTLLKNDVPFKQVFYDAQALSEIPLKQKVQALAESSKYGAPEDFSRHVTAMLGAALEQKDVENATHEKARLKARQEAKPPPPKIKSEDINFTGQGTTGKQWRHSLGPRTGASRVREE